MECESKFPRPKPKIAVSKETTYVTGPLREDGYVDYVAAINERCSRGVTRENNAVIPFWRAMGPKEIDPKIRTRYFELLGMPELPEQGDYMVSFRDFLLAERGETECKRANSEYEPWDQETQRRIDNVANAPWSRDDFPLMAALLDHNGKNLQALVDGLRRPRFYSPLASITTSGSAPRVFFSVATLETRKVAWQLRIRAMLRLSEGDVAGAWEDIITVFHLARLAAQGPLMVDRLVAFTLEGIAAKAAVKLSMHDGLAAAQARVYQADLDNLPAMPLLQTVFDQGERFYQLYFLLENAIAGRNWECEPPSKDMDPGLLEVLAAIAPERENRAEAWTRLVDGDVDWTEVFRCVNSWHGRLAAIFDKADWADQLAEIAAWEEDAATKSQESLETVLENDSWRVHAMPADEKARHIAAIELGIGLSGCNRPCIVSDRRRQVEFDLTLVAFALAGYRHDHGRYPGTLAQMFPNYIAEIPLDAFSDDNLLYRSDGNGYLLYSVGPNLQDDGGRNFIHDHQDDWSDWESATEEEKAADDIAIRTPAQ